MNRKLYILGSLCLICLCLSVFFIRESYAKYLTALDETANITVARWRILVNNNDIRDGRVASTVITPTFTGNEHMAANIIAPTAEGYFDLIIDSSGADVSFNYSLSVSVNENSSVSDLIVTGYSLNNGTTVTVTENPITEGTILYSAGVTTNTIRVFIKWDDSNTATMNNVDDTAAAAGTAKLDVSLHFTQVAN